MQALDRPFIVNMLLVYLCPSKLYLLLYCYLALVIYYSQLYLSFLLFGFSIITSEFVIDSNLPIYVRYAYRYIYLSSWLLTITWMIWSLEDFKPLICATMVLALFLARNSLDILMLLIFVTWSQINDKEKQGFIWSTIAVGLNLLISFYHAKHLDVNWGNSQPRESLLFIFSLLYGVLGFYDFYVLDWYHQFLVIMWVLTILILKEDKDVTVRLMKKNTQLAELAEVPCSQSILQISP